MSDDDLCGHPTTKGGTCQNPADSCPWHNVDDPPKNGRKSKLTKEREEQIAQMIEQGRSFRSACRMSGIDPQTGFNWMKWGEEQENTIYADFFERITRAKGHGEEWYFNTIAKMAKEEGDHRFLASLMKQRYPDSWQDTETGVESDRTTIELPESVTKEWQRQHNTQ